MRTLVLCLVLTLCTPAFADTSWRRVDVAPGVSVEFPRTPTSIPPPEEFPPESALFAVEFARERRLYSVSVYRIADHRFNTKDPTHNLFDALDLANIKWEKKDMVVEKGYLAAESSVGNEIAKARVYRKERSIIMLCYVGDAHVSGERFLASYRLD